MVDPPWRLDPYQNIVGVHWRDRNDNTGLNDLILVGSIIVGGVGFGVGDFVGFEPDDSGIYIGGFRSVFNIKASLGISATLSFANFNFSAYEVTGIEPFNQPDNGNKAETQGLAAEIFGQVTAFACAAGGTSVSGSATGCNDKLSVAMSADYGGIEIKEKATGQKWKANRTTLPFGQPIPSWPPFYTLNSFSSASCTFQLYCKAET